MIFQATISMGALKNTISVERMTANQTMADRLADMVMIAPLERPSGLKTQSSASALAT